MKKISRFALSALFFLYGGIVIAAPKLPTVEILGEKYYVYDVKKGDSLYGIAKQYGWDSEQLTRYNRQAISNLEKGTQLYYPVVNDSPKNHDDKFTSVDLSQLPVEPLSHVVKRGENVYSISQVYNIPVETIYQLNPSAKSGLKAGEIIKLSQKSIEAEPIKGSNIFYTVKPDDTLYSLATTYGTTVESILNLNPGLSDKNFKSGQIIKLPTDHSGIKITEETYKEPQVVSFNSYKVKSDDTWETISSSTGVSREDLIKTNRNQRTPRKNSVVSIPVIDSVSYVREVVATDPRERSSEGVSEIYNEVNKISSSDTLLNVKMVLLMADPASRRDLDVARGMLTAIDRLKRSGNKITFQVIDGSAAANDVLGELNETKPNIVFYTSEKSLPSFLTDYAETSKTPVVNLFDTKSETYTTNPYIVQFLTPSNYFNESVANRLVKDYKESRVLFVGNDEESDPIADVLKNEMTDSQILTLSLDEFADYPFFDNDRYLIYANPTKKNEITRILDRVATARTETPLADIAIVGRPSWIVYEETLKDKFHNVGLIIPSRFYLDTNSEPTRSFVSDYKGLFDHNPVKSYPLYSGVGFDMINYFAPALSRNGGDMNELGEYSYPLQNDIKLTRVSNWGGMFNPICYLIRYTSYNTVETEPIGNN